MTLKKIMKTLYIVIRYKINMSMSELLAFFYGKIEIRNRINILCPFYFFVTELFLDLIMYSFVHIILLIHGCND